MFSVEHASSMGPAMMEVGRRGGGGGGGGGATGFLLSTLTSCGISTGTD